MTMSIAVANGRLNELGGKEGNRSENEDKQNLGDNRWDIDY
jgi:hypothetical protein